MKSMRHKLVFAAALCVAMQGCGSNTSPANQTLIRSLNAYVPPAGTTTGIVATVQGITLTDNPTLGFGQFAFQAFYTSITSGTFTPSVSGPGIPTATPLTFPVPPAITGNRTPYVFVIAGESGQTGTFAPQLILIPNFLKGQLAIPAGSVAVRLVNVSENPNPVGLYTTTGGTPTAPLASAVASEAFGYSAASNTYTIVPISALKNLAVVDTTAPGTALTLSSASDLNNFIFQSGWAVTLYVYGHPGNTVGPFGASWSLDYPVL